MFNNRVSVFRKENFNAAHRLHNPTWDEAKNNAVFGKCNNPNYHGHNYDLIVQVIGIPQADTGYVMDTKILSDIIKEKITERFDHKNLNEDCIEFKDLNPTAENIVIVIFNILRPEIDSSLELKLRLYETERNFVEYPV
jgi:6-pyruvoyltetrahydropterin/6-carboxytetrahydropterin synthase